MALRLHNTLTRSPEEFEPLEEGHVRYYTCGPTVYDRAHIGNFRTFVWEDLLRRYLEWKGYRVTQVMNLTDVDDKTIREAVERGVSLREVTDPVTEMFFEDWETLGLEEVEATPRATETVDAMIRLVEALEEAGLTYESDGSVYFSIADYEDYGQLVELDPEQLESAGRAESDEVYDKDDPRDFVLWKGGEREDEGDVATWDSPWGEGRPGWHLECSVMALEELGPTIDIHAGGVDLIFPHHENEIAQAEGATGEPFVRFWLHAKHLLVEGEKMSKSLGNFYTIPDLLEKGYRGSAIRYLLLSGHYRSELNFTLEGLDEAERALDRLEEFRRRVRRAEVRDGGGSGPAGDLPELAREARASFEAAMDDDLNVSDARGAVFGLVRRVNGRLDESGDRLTAEGREAVLGTLEDFDRVFGVLSLRERERAAIPEELRQWVEERLEARAAARERDDYERADDIRRELESRGVQVEDAPDGSTRWKLREGEFAAAG